MTTEPMPRSEVTSDGSIENDKWPYMDWTVGSVVIVLDGSFTIQQLKSIVAHMGKSLREFFQ